ncbi:MULTISPECIES: hypothetical protein [Bradyrhizobium]|uniref:hypothetical protein n=1 Tax=Bradyrhizobium TaxID=374 RepID=UPI00048956AD|nr:MULTISPECIES: hypothetical protein [Bradyrhizobium]UFW46371.1 hypothetical protein BaraCB756_29200 [Bradyrhizobium arachidis]
MSEPPDVLDRIRTREVTGVFHSRKALDAAAQDLLSSGFDRADIDVSASPDEQQRRLNYQAIPAADLADIPAAARRPYVGGDDRLGLEVVTASVVGCVVALVMAFYLVSREMTPPSVILVSVLGGIVAAAVAIRPLRRVMQRDRVRGLEPVAEWEGLLIWVRVQSPEKEALAQEILLRHDGEAVHIHEIDIAKTADDLPLHSLRPDPWLGNEPLGRP